jgi:hypothetical protein
VNFAPLCGCTRRLRDSITQLSNAFGLLLRTALSKEPPLVLRPQDACRCYNNGEICSLPGPPARSKFALNGLAINAQK